LAETQKQRKTFLGVITRYNMYRRKC